MDMEAGGGDQFAQKTSWRTILLLSYQSFGVVYGGLCISPLYIYKSLFSGGIKINEGDVEILGITSFIIWTFTLITLVKYAIIVIRADDNGEGGTHALYSLLCRHANLSLFPKHKAMDRELLIYKFKRNENLCDSQVNKTIDRHHRLLRAGVLVSVLLGACMIIVDGVLTPSISVLSAVSGAKVEWDRLNEKEMIVIACALLIILFVLQRYGTCKLGFMFAPIVIVWLFCIAIIGTYNIIYWNPGVFKALSPLSMYHFLKKTGTDSLLILGGVILSIAGTEAMFADLGHFSAVSIKISFMGIVYPCLVLGYLGQGAFLSKHPNLVERSFYESIPEPIFWPVFVVSTLASVVGSQAIISATFSTISQCSSMGFFPRVKVMHTSKTIYGRIYIPEVNWVLMILCLAITIIWKDTAYIGHAYGIVLITILFITTCLMALVIFLVWRKSIWVALSFFAVFGLIEFLYLLAAFIKVPEGGWIALVLATTFMVIMSCWTYGVQKKHEYESDNKLSVKWLVALGPSLGMVRVPGIGLVYTQLATGVPSMFSHLVTNLPAFHHFVVFVTIKSVHVPYVPSEERYLIGRIGPEDLRLFRCVVCYGYKEDHRDNHDFESDIVLRIAEFIQTGGDSVNNKEDNPLDNDDDNAHLRIVGSSSSSMRIVALDPETSVGNVSLHTLQSYDAEIEAQSASFESGHGLGRKVVRFELPPEMELAPTEELLELIQAKEAGTVYILGHSNIKAKRGSPLIRRVALDVVYNFLRQNCRNAVGALRIPHTCLIEVGMVCHI